MFNYLLSCLCVQRASLDGVCRRLLAWGFVFLFRRGKEDARENTHMRIGQHRMKDERMKMFHAVIAENIRECLPCLLAYLPALNAAFHSLHVLKMIDVFLLVVRQGVLENVSTC